MNAGTWSAAEFLEAARFCNASGAHATTIDAVRLGLEAYPDTAMLHVYRACAYDEFGRSAEALADLETALRIAPQGETAIRALITVALVRERIGDTAGALAAVDAAIACDPNDREAHAARGTLLAWHGAYPAAWSELECHWLDERIACMQRFPGQTEWDGEDVAGKRLLLVHDQGLGDFLQMLRYVPRLRERGATVTLECPQTLYELVRGTRCAERVVVKDSVARDAFDVYGRVMTLARLCAEDGTVGQSGVPYLTADPLRRAEWAKRLGARDGRTRAGIVWAGNPDHPNDRRRSIALDAFAPLAAVANVRWIALQSGDRGADAAPSGMELERFGAGLNTLSETAALIGELDLVITIDTSVAHLAGALGKPVWVLLPWRPDWRWRPGARETPWYPTMRLFHATGPDFSAAIAQLAEELAQPPSFRA